MKRELLFKQPRMNAAGMLGFAPDLRSEIPWDTFGAFVTNPISFRPRNPAAFPAQIDFPVGCLLHTGLPNPGIEEVIARNASRWARAALPVIVHLMADRPEETQRILVMLESLENVQAVELGFAPLLSDDILLLTTEKCMGELPLIVSLPFERLLSLGPRLIQAGASAISLSAPRGKLPRFFSSKDKGTKIEEFLPGRMYGRALFPLALNAVFDAARLGLPIIGAGGISSEADIQTMLQAGALAVQIDIQLWMPLLDLNK